MAGERILVVEDEGIVALNISKLIEKAGFTVAGIVSSGEDAVMQAMNVRPDLVLMDVTLNGLLDGIDAASKIRDLFHIPVIFLTAHTDEKTLQRAKLAGPFGYIVKPFRERDLYISIEFALYKAKMENEKDSLLRQLQDALASIKTLSGLIPICAYCKKIRNDKGYWDQIEHYISTHTDAKFSHGLCPVCAKKVDPTFDCERKDV